MSEGDISQTVVDKNRSKKKTFQFAIIILLIILAVGIIFSLITGLLYVGVKKPEQRVIVQTLVCDNSESIKKLNTYLDDVTNGDQSKTKEAIEFIKNQSDYDSDPTCVEALARFYYIDRNIQDLSNQIDKLESLAKEGLYPSNHFDGLSSIYTNSINFENLTGESR